MNTLLDLHPQWIGLLRPNSGEGITLDCPACGPSHRLAAYFKNPLDGGETAGWLLKDGPVWERQGDDFAALTIKPSIDYPCFHGWIERGRVFHVNESPLRAAIRGPAGNVVLANLSPLQTIEIGGAAIAKANALLGSQ